MKPKGMGQQGYAMMANPNKKTKMVSLVKRDKSGKPIPEVRGGAGLFGYIGPGSGLKAAANIKNLSSAAKQAKAVFKPKVQAELATATLKPRFSLIQKGISAGKKMFKAFTNAPKQYMKAAGKNVPIVGKPGKTVKVPKSSKTKQVSYVNPRISMTAEQRRKAGY